LLIISLVFLAWCGHPEGGSGSGSAENTPKGEVWLTQDQVSAAKIKLTQAAMRPMANPLVTGGKISFDDLLVSHIYSPVTGRVAQIYANLGQKLKAGDKLALIESPDLGSAYSDMLKANADLVAAEHDIKRQKELFQAEAVSQAQLEQSEDNYRRASAEMERAKLKLKLLKTNASDIVSQQYILRTTIDGEVVGRQINPGIEVQGMLSGANVANELFTVGSLERVWMVGDIYEADLGQVKPGQPVQITTVAYPGEVFNGTIDYVSNTLDPVTRVAHVRCTIENPEKKLKPEMYVTTTVELGERVALAIPESAVLRNLGNKTMVFVKQKSTETGGQHFAVRPVEIAESDRGWTEVKHGLQSGDVVVSDGAILLSGQL
jgi:cobalt-zinc-cadmium efflux system membrane fusion protein